MEKEKKIFKVVIEWGAYALIFFLIVWGTPTILTKVLDSEYPIAAITSSSMWPELKRGDIVFIKGASERRDIKIGDIVVFANEATSINQESFTIHRVISLNEEDFITRGDANNVDDSPVEYSRLIGRAVEFKERVFRIPHLGKLSQILKK